MTPTYWEWYIIALFSPTQAIWLPITMMWIRFVPVSLARMHDTTENFSTIIGFFDMGEAATFQGLSGHLSPDLPF